MGAKLSQMFDQAVALGGNLAKVRLVMYTGVTSTTANDMADTPEAIRKFEDALARIRRENAS